MLHVPDDLIVPIDEPEGSVRPDLEIGGPKVRVGRLEDGLDFGADETRPLVLDAILEDPQKPDHVGDEQVALVLLGKVLTGQNRGARTGTRTLLVDERRARVLLRVVHLA